MSVYHIQSAIVSHLNGAGTAMFAAIGARAYWATPPASPAPSFVRVRKAGHRPLALGMDAPRRWPAIAEIEIVAYAKSQDLAADLMDAVSSDVLALYGAVPNTSPPTSGAPYVTAVEPSEEEDIVSEEARIKGLFLEAHLYLVTYEYR
jgi:hypothetical protein